MDKKDILWDYEHLKVEASTKTLGLHSTEVLVLLDYGYLETKSRKKWEKLRLRCCRDLNEAFRSFPQ